MRDRRSDRQEKRRDPGVAISVVAREGGGKTDCGLTLPAPRVVISIDPNTRAIIDKAIEEGRATEDDTTLHSFTMPTVAFDTKDDLREEAAETMDQILEALRPIVKRETETRSVIIDTATELDTLNVMATFGKTDQIHPEQRKNLMGPVNRRYAGIVRALQDAGVHVALLHRAYDQYRSVTEEVRVAGRGKQIEEKRVKCEGIFDFERRGWKDTGYITSVEILLAHDENRSEKLASQFGMKIVRCGLRPALKGTEYWGREKQEDGSRVRKASWAYLMTRIYPKTKLSEWE